MCNLTPFGVYLDQNLCYIISTNYHYYIKRNNDCRYTVAMGYQSPREIFENKLQLMHFSLYLDKIWYNKCLHASIFNNVTTARL